MAIGVARSLDHLLCFHHGELQDLVGDMHATLQNGARCEKGVGLVLDGSGAHASLNPTQIGGEMSIAIRVMVNELATGKWTRLFDFSDDEYTEHIFMDVHPHGESSWQTYTGRTWGEHPRVREHLVLPGRWVTLVGTVYGDVMSFYKDGKLLRSIRSPAREPPSITRKSHLIGLSLIGDGHVAPVNGTVASMAIWSRALSNSEVSILSCHDLADLVQIRILSLHSDLSATGEIRISCTNAAGEEIAELVVAPEDFEKKVSWLQEQLMTLTGHSELSLRLLTSDGSVLGESEDDWNAPLGNVFHPRTQNNSDCRFVDSSLGEVDGMLGQLVEAPISEEKV